MASVKSQALPLNGICPYFTMFPLKFPLETLHDHVEIDTKVWVLDPFCGRGTTNLAARMLGHSSVGVDGNPVAVAISKSKLVNTTPDRIIRSAQAILDRIRVAQDIPCGEFWDLAFDPEVLNQICCFREELLRDCRSDSRIALRAIILGALHGPQLKTKDSYFSNQSQRTYSPKPAYAVKYWRKHNLTPRKVDVLGVIKERANRYFTELPPRVGGRIYFGDSREGSLFDCFAPKFNWIITSPPYYGMRTYLPDQWLRLWFLGGNPFVEYSMNNQVQHNGPEPFAADLSKVWRNARSKAMPDAKMVIRFGGLNDRRADPEEIIRSSLDGTGWQVLKVTSAGSASSGRRQADHINGKLPAALEEIDIWAARQP